MGERVKLEAVEKITSRLSLKDNLYFPRSVQQTAAIATQRKALLSDLLSRDAAVFLERYGSELSKEELDEFEPAGDDYEVRWHLRNLRSSLTPTSEDVRLRSVRVRNRRQAYLEKAVRIGSYFSEEAMREREPYLHHEMIGRFQDAAARGMPLPGEKWSETLMRRCEEADLMEKIRVEQERCGDGEEDEVEDEENEIEREEIGDEEMAERMEQFTFVMQQKFLAGEDHQHLDYCKIDGDESLDDHWNREASLDAEEKYFAGEDD